MLVDNSPFSPSYFAPPAGGDYAELNDIFDTDLFNNSFAQSAGSSASPADSRGSSPHVLMTPPQDPGPASFPDVHDEEDQASQSHPFFSMYAGDIKPIDDGTSADFMGLGPIDSAFAPDLSPYGFSYSPPSAFDPMDMGVGTSDVDSTQLRGINPQLVDTPSAISDHGDDDTEDIKPANPPVAEKKETERLTVTIAPSKVGSAKSRKGAVQSGGVAKKTALSSIAKEKENAIAALAAKRPASTRAAKASTPASSSSISSPMFLTGGDSVYAFSDAGDEDEDDDHDSLRGDRRVDFKDDLPHDWRPPPEVLAKMSSKEKRQLRNKISARNFRVRRKEYISTLEGDIAERDRLLDHFRTQLGSRESENLALRQEVAALKKALLDGRGGPINLPPPAPLPEQSAAEQLAAAANAPPSGRSSSSLVTPNTHKDLPSSPRLGARFWGGVGMGTGVTPVHTTLVPDISHIVRRGLQENMNPALNAQASPSFPPSAPMKGFHGFDGFADANPFTMKTLDAYRMHLWGKMASQHPSQSHPTHPTAHLSGLAAGMRPAYFSGSQASKAVAPATGSSLSAILSGKGSTAYPTPPASPHLNPKSLPSTSTSKEISQREKDQQHAMIAALASQTLFRKLGSAFWEAFTGSSSSHSSDWDHEKVQRVLEGKAVLKVVDVEPTPTTSSIVPLRSSTTMTAPKAAPKMKTLQSSTTERVSPTTVDKRCASAECMNAVVDILEESMRSLTVTKKM